MVTWLCSIQSIACKNAELDAKRKETQLKELKERISQGLIPITVASSAATSGIGTINDPCQCTGKPSHKQCILPSVIPGTEIAEYPFEVRKFAKILHITPGVSQNSLLSTVKFADTNYITIFDKDTVNIYNANYTIITVTKGGILWGWQDKNNNRGAFH